MTTQTQRFRDDVKMADDRGQNGRFFALESRAKQQPIAIKIGNKHGKTEERFAVDVTPARLGGDADRKIRVPKW
jgi:hypothetical protein